MRHVRGVAHTSHAPRPMGGMINNPKVIGDHGNTGDVCWNKILNEFF